MIKLILRTDADYLFTALRLIAGIVIWPYGMQKLSGWFGGVGNKGTLEQMAVKKIPRLVAWLVIIGQSFGSIALILGLFTRSAAGGLFSIFTGALIVHLPAGWTMNWFGKKRVKELSITYCFSLYSWRLSSGGGALINGPLVDIQNVTCLHCDPRLKSIVSSLRAVAQLMNFSERA